MASPRPRRRRFSMEHPPSMLSDVIHLNEELDRLYKDISPEINKHKDKISDLITEFNNGYRLAIYALRGAIIAGAIGVVLSALSLFLNNDFVAGAGGVVAVVAALCAAFGLYKKTQQEKKLKRSIDEERKGFQEKISLIIDMLEKMCQRIEEILRNLSLSVHRAQALREHFADCFEKRQLFQVDDNSKLMSKIVHLSGNLSEMIAKVSSVPNILKEIIEDNKRQHDKPAKTTHEQKNIMEFNEKADQFINDMQKGICQLKYAVKELDRTTDRMSNLFN